MYLLSSAGQVASRTSKNNFINDCLTQKLPLTNGEQCVLVNPALVALSAET